MVVLFIFRGLPASGKTTEARRRLAEAEAGTLIRLNRDDLRRMGLVESYREPLYPAEQRISTVRDAALGALLVAGCDVIVDDTNLRARYVRQLMTIAAGAGAHVGEKVIRDMHARHLAALNGGPLPVPELAQEAPAPVEPYVAIPGTPRAVLVDVDGTMALLNGRNPYDETCVSADLPNTPVIDVVRALVSAEYWPVFLSGRTEACRDDTAAWIAEHVGLLWTTGTTQIELHMRAVGDTRPDHVVKRELFDAHVRQRYDVRCVLDDRDSVVALWRSLGLTCLQVAEGAF